MNTSPKEKAKSLLSELKIRKPTEIDIELIAGYLGVIVKIKKLKKEDGRLLRKKNIGIISVKEEAYKTKNWRFIIAHEVGHFMIHQGISQLNLCTDADTNGMYSKSTTEKEANEFASELLMPETMFKKLCDVNAPSLNHVREIAEKFQTSLTSTSIRFIQFTPEPCALICSKDGKIDWFSKTKDFKFFLKKGFPLHHTSYAYDIFQRKKIPDKQQLLEADSWTDDNKASGQEIYEHSLQISSEPITVITLLWHRY